MKRRLLWLSLGILLGMVAGYFYLRAPAPAPAPTPAGAPPAPPVNIAIEDGQTIDFSSGQPVVTESAEDRAALEHAKREMEEAAKDVTFSPKPAAPAR
jgi:hypothetical protein